MTPRMMLRKGEDEIPKKGDLYRVTGVYPGSTDELWRPRVEVTLERVKDKDTNDRHNQDKTAR